MKTKRLVLACSYLVGSMLSSASNAHDIYIWPDYFTLNSDKSTTVPVDITATHTTYRSDFSMPSEGVKIFGTDGKEIRYRGAFSNSVFTKTCANVSISSNTIPAPRATAVSGSPVIAKTTSLRYAEIGWHIFVWASSSSAPAF